MAIRSDQWPHEVSSITKGGIEQFKPVVVTIDRVTNGDSGPGYKFAEDTSRSDFGTGIFWNQKGEWNKSTGKHDAYQGHVYEVGQTVSASLAKADKYKGGFVNNMELADGNPFDKKGDPGPESTSKPASKSESKPKNLVTGKPTDRDLRISQAQALNLISAALQNEKLGPLLLSFLLHDQKESSRKRDAWVQCWQRGIDNLIKGDMAFEPRFEGDSPVPLPPHPRWESESFEEISKKIEGMELQPGELDRGLKAKERLHRKYELFEIDEDVLIKLKTLIDELITPKPPPSAVELAEESNRQEGALDGDDTDDDEL